jgi:hypothetical protein
VTFKIEIGLQSVVMGQSEARNAWILCGNAATRLHSLQPLSIARHGCGWYDFLVENAGQRHYWFWQHLDRLLKFLRMALACLAQTRKYALEWLGILRHCSITWYPQTRLPSERDTSYRSVCQVIRLGDTPHRRDMRGTSQKHTNP